MESIDSLCDEEIQILNHKILSSEQITKEISLLFKDVHIVRSSLDLASEYINRKEYTSAYKSMLHSLSYLIHIHEQLLQKYTEAQNVIKDFNDNSSEKN